MSHQGDKPAGRHNLHCMEIWGGNEAVENVVTTPGLDAWIFSQPHEAANRGGDVHYLSLCGGGIITRIILADVSGHGAAVAELAVELRTLMRRYINNKSQTRLVRSLNRRFSALAQLSRFATAVVATYLATRDRLTVCNAGHPRPLWYRAASRQWTLLSPESPALAAVGSNLPLGLDDETPYDQFAIDLGPDDVVLLYTDALIEATNPAGQSLGEAGLLELACRLDPSDPARLGPSLIEAVGRHRGGLPPEDDLSLLSLHHNANPPPSLSLGEKLDVYAKVFGLKSV